MLQEKISSGLIFLRSDQLDVPHALFTRAGGVSPPPWASLNCGLSTGDETHRIWTNIDRMKRVIGARKLVLARQVHGKRVVRIGPDDHDPETREADAMITDQPGTALLIQQADCQAVLLYDPARKAIAAVHSGWRGSMANIIGTTIGRMKRDFGTEPSTIQAVISPSLGPCCAEFVNYVREIRPDYYPHVDRNRHVDFWAISRTQLIQAGVSANRIDCAALCTCCDRRFFSYRRGRRKGQSETGRCGSLILLP